MKINALEIDGYGVWTGLRIERLSDGLSVLYGAERGGQNHPPAIHPLDALRIFAGSGGSISRLSTAEIRAE